MGEKRKTERMEYAATVQCLKTIADGAAAVFDPPLAMGVMNIAPEGLCVSSPQSFKENALLTFDVTLEDIVYPGVSATIIWKTSKNDIYYYGIHFQNIPGKLGTHIVEIGRKVFKEV